MENVCICYGFPCIESNYRVVALNMSLPQPRTAVTGEMAAGRQSVRQGQAASLTPTPFPHAPCSLLPVPSTTCPYCCLPPCACSAPYLPFPHSTYTLLTVSMSPNTCTFLSLAPLSLFPHTAAYPKSWLQVQLWVQSLSSMEHKLASIPFLARSSGCGCGCGSFSSGHHRLQPHKGGH